MAFDTLRLDPLRWAGFRAVTTARSTGTLVVLVDGPSQGLQLDDGGRWALICDPHGEVCQFERQRDALVFLSHPEEWCSSCQADRS